MSRDGLAELKAFELVFAALAHETRRHILVVINAQGGQMAAGDIAKRFHHKWPTITRHLGVLRDAGLLRVEKRGRERIYHLERDTLIGVTDGWLRWFRNRE